MAWFCRSCGYELADTKKEVLKLGKCSECGGTKVKRVREGEPVLNVGMGQKIEKGESPLPIETLRNSITGIYPLTKIKAEETVSIDEAVRYGFETFKGIFKYFLLIFSLAFLAFFVMYVVSGLGEPRIGYLIAIPILVVVYVFSFSLIVGIFYKFWVDILARSRK